MIGMVRRIEIVAIVGMFAVGSKLDWYCMGVCRWWEFYEVGSWWSLGVVHSLTHLLIHSFKNFTYLFNASPWPDPKQHRRYAREIRSISSLRLRCAFRA